MNVTEFKEKFFDENGEFWDYSQELDVVEDIGTFYDEGVFQATTIYSVKDQEGYFRISVSWDDGFDPFKYPYVVEKVEPIIVKKTDWRVIEAG